jgi:hypothetical protein
MELEERLATNEIMRIFEELGTFGRPNINDQ